jgi:nucleotide-binding universal stress UspA family protein
VLLEAAHGADLLVIGSRGHGGFASMVLGSVSMHCVLHAPCPVTVVPTPRPDQAAEHERRLTGAAR